MIELETTDLDSTIEDDEKDDKVVENSLFSNFVFALKCSNLTYEFIVLVIAYVCDGIVNTMFSPLMIELSHLVHCERDDIGWIITTRNCGRIISITICMFLYQILKRCFNRFGFSPIIRVLQLAFFLMTVCICLVPAINHLWIILVNYFFIGFFFSLIDVGINVEACDVFDNCGVNFVLQVLHGSYAFGTCLFPLITTQILRIGDDFVEIEILYWSCGGLLLMCFFLMFYICSFPNLSSINRCVKISKKSKTRNESNEMDKKDDPKCKRKFIYVVKYLWVYFLAAGIKAVSVGIYDSYGPYIDLYTKNENLASDDTSSYMVFTFWLSLAFGRICSALVVKCFPYVFILTSIHIFLLIVIFIFLWIMSDFFWCVWLCTCSIGFVIGPLSPYAVGLGENFFNLPISPVSVGMAYIAANIACIILSAVVNSFQKKYDKFLFPTCLVLCIIGVVFLVLILVTRICCFRNTGKEKEKGILSCCFNENCKTQICNSCAKSEIIRNEGSEYQYAIDEDFCELNEIDVELLEEDYQSKSI